MGEGCDAWIVIPAKPALGNARGRQAHTPGRGKGGWGQARWPAYVHQVEVCLRVTPLSDARPVRAVLE